MSDVSQLHGRRGLERDKWSWDSLV
jgi:hypothetical protein